MVKARAWVIRVAVSAVLGVIVTIGVTWGLVLAEPECARLNAWSGVFFQGSDNEWYWAIEQTRFSYRNRQISHSRDPSADATARGGAAHAGSRPAWVPPDLTKQTLWMSIDRGWPLYAMTITDRVTMSSSGSPSGNVRDLDRRILVRLFGRDHALPITPTWGFMGDVLIWGGAYMGLAAGVSEIRRRRRIGRRCVNCGYSREGLAVDAQCPECGTAQGASVT